MPALADWHRRATARPQVGKGLRVAEGQPRPTALAGWALAQVDVAAVGPVALPAELAVQHIDALAMIRPR